MTDMRRGETIFEINPELQEQVELGIKTNGSNLSGVSARCVWIDTSGQQSDEHSPPKLSQEGCEIFVYIIHLIQHIFPGVHQAR